MNFQSSLLIVSQFCSAVHSKVSLEALKNQRQEIWHPPFCFDDSSSATLWDSHIKKPLQENYVMA